MADLRPSDLTAFRGENRGWFCSVRDGRRVLVATGGSLEVRLLEQDFDNPER